MRYIFHIFILAIIGLGLIGCGYKAPPKYIDNTSQKNGL